MKYFLILILCVYITGTLGQSKFKTDFSYYWETINKNFAYFDRQKTDWEKVKEIYEPAADTIKTEKGFIRLLENVNNELYNGHIFLNVNTKESNRLLPSGSDMKVSREDNKYIITEIREGYSADLCGLKTGMVIMKYNDIPVDSALQRFLPKSVADYDDRMFEYSVNMLLAGTHNTKRKITVLDEGREKSFYPDSISSRTDENYNELLQSKIIAPDIGYIRINNSLGNPALIKAFDDAIDSLMSTDGLILDLRETPGGGNTTVARAIMGRFIDKELPYQKHIYFEEEKETGIRRSTLELVSPRREIYTKPLIVLVGNWTASMGEGLAIGFDGLKRADVVGTTMACLLGEIYTFETPELKIPFSFPCVKLQHINGQPREEYIPGYLVKEPKDTFDTGLNLLIKDIKNK
jgi:carboxyl-terminal processing protease